MTALRYHIQHKRLGACYVEPASLYGITGSNEFPFITIESIGPAMKLIKSFVADEDGAVTVDWVVLTAATVLLGAVVSVTISPAVNNEVAVVADGIER